MSGLKIFSANLPCRMAPMNRIAKPKNNVIIMWQNRDFISEKIEFRVSALFRAVFGYSRRLLLYIFLIFIVTIMFNSLTSAGEPSYTNL